MPRKRNRSSDNFFNRDFLERVRRRRGALTDTEKSFLRSAFYTAVRAIAFEDTDMRKACFGTSMDDPGQDWPLRFFPWEGDVGLMRAVARAVDECEGSKSPVWGVEKNEVWAKRMGMDVRWHSRISLETGEVDHHLSPALSSADFRHYASKLRAAGLRRVTLVAPDDPENRFGSFGGAGDQQPRGTGRRRMMGEL